MDQVQHTEHEQTGEALQPRSGAHYQGGSREGLLGEAQRVCGVRGKGMWAGRAAPRYEFDESGMCLPYSIYTMHYSEYSCPCAMVLICVV